LGYSTQSRTHDALGEALDVPPKSIQNWRDEFDPVHPNNRQGWHKRPMAPSRVRVIEALSHLKEPELRAIVTTVIADPNLPISNDLVHAINLSETGDTESQQGNRGLTGMVAEQAFSAYHASTSQPIAGKLVDCRHDGCGYDCRIETESTFFAIEVKGMANGISGITLTNKEWTVAGKMLERYFLAIVRNALTQPSISFVQNPAECLSPQMHVYTQVQINWSVANSVINSMAK
jgi:hypothetical protein